MCSLRWNGVKALTLSTLLFAGAANAEMAEWESASGGNGHTYEVFGVPEGVSITWQEACYAAETVGGHLATVTSEEENDFIFSLLADEYWYGGCSGPYLCFGPWIGGLQAGDDWRWVTGEEFAFTAWEDGEPNDLGGDEDFIRYFTLRGEPSSRWNDAWNEARFRTNSYVVEYGTDLSLIHI